MVSMGRNGRPQPVKPYTPETEDEKRMYEEVKARKDHAKEINSTGVSGSTRNYIWNDMMKQMI